MASNKEKYLLLSCKEFDNVVEQMITTDKSTCNSKISSINNKNPGYKTYLENIGAKESSAILLAEYKKKMTKCESKNFIKGFINWGSYPDGTPNIKMDKDTTTKLKGRKVIFLAYFTFNESNVTTIIDQIMFLNSLSHYGVAEINIVLPFFPVGTMERIVGEGEIPTGYSLAHMINSIPQGDTKNKIYIFDIHALCSRFFFNTNVIPILVTMMPEYINHIEKITNETNVIVFPDDGAKKRFEKVLPKDFLKITCSKQRIGTDRIIKIDDGLEKLLNTNKTLKSGIINFFIIDDLVQTGRTLTETIKGIRISLKDTLGYNAEKLKFHPIVTHSIFPNDKNNSFFNNPDITSLITTDSRPTKINEMKDKKNGIKLQVMPISVSLTNIFKGEPGNYIAPYILS